MNAATCRHCNAVHDADKIAAHEARCPSSPSVHAATVALLSDPAAPGYARGRDEYTALSAVHPHATPRHVLLALHGSWRAACEAYGLKMRGRARRRVSVQAKVVRAKAETEEMQLAARQSADIQRTRDDEQVRGLEVCGCREIDGGRRVAWVLR